MAMKNHMRLIVAGVAVAMCIAASTAYAVTVRDIVALSRAGLSEEILLAVIEADKTVFTLTPDQIVELKRAGVSDRVIVAMLQQGRIPQPSAEPPAPVDSWTPQPAPDYSVPPAPAPAPPPPSTTVVVVPTPVLYPYPIFVPQRPFTRVHCTPGRIIGRTEKLTNPVPGSWIENGRTGGMVFVSDPVCQ